MVWWLTPFGAGIVPGTQPEEPKAQSRRHRLVIIRSKSYVDPLARQVIQIGVVQIFLTEQAEFAFGTPGERRVLCVDRLVSLKDKGLI